LSDQPPFEPHRFHEAAAYYRGGRAPYPPILIRRVAEIVGLRENHRVLDLGCGPGPLAIGFAYFAGDDHYGRRMAIISGAAFFGLFTLASVLAQNLGTLIVLRFIAGVGISGVLPITTALVNEYSPRRVRATLFVLMFSGVTFGGGLPGIVAAKFMGTYGWQVLFWVGGIAQILVAILVYFTLPESTSSFRFGAKAIWSSFASSPSCNPGSHSIPIRHSPSVARKTARSSPIRRSSMVASLGLRQCSGSRMRSI
jgi:MFS family permease